MSFLFVFLDRTQTKLLGNSVKASLCIQSYFRFFGLSFHTKIEEAVIDPNLHIFFVSVTLKRWTGWILPAMFRVSSRTVASPMQRSEVAVFLGTRTRGGGGVQAV